MSSGELLSIEPTQLEFHFELKRPSSCSMQLTNKTDQFVAFKVKTTNPKNYSVQPNSGIILPRTTSYVTVTMQAQKEEPYDTTCKDKFLIQSVYVSDGSTVKVINPKMFIKDGNKVVDELQLRVICVPANASSLIENGNQHAVSTSLEDQKSKSYEAWSMISKLTDEKSLALHENQNLRTELERMRKEIGQSNADGFSLLIVALILLSGIFVGYLVK